mmetsp:Transcript_74126/g.193375  ORF Transcript_74126/g.193375 Transcript_74126/m.193375 type:complete len:283 (-) Transcript_74126:231-1079(-)
MHGPEAQRGGDLRDDAGAPQGAEAGVQGKHHGVHSLRDGTKLVHFAVGPVERHLRRLRGRRGRAGQAFRGAAGQAAARSEVRHGVALPRLRRAAARAVSAIGAMNVDCKEAYPVGSVQDVARKSPQEALGLQAALGQRLVADALHAVLAEGGLRQVFGGPPCGVQDDICHQVRERGAAPVAHDPGGSRRAAQPPHEVALHVATRPPGGLRDDDVPQNLQRGRCTIHGAPPPARRVELQELPHGGASLHEPVHCGGRDLGQPLDARGGLGDEQDQLLGVPHLR